MNNTTLVAAMALMGLGAGCGDGIQAPGGGAEQPGGGVEQPGGGVEQPGDGAEEPGGEAPQQLSADQVIEGWDDRPRSVADELIQEYGQPDEVTESMLVWHDNGAWVHTVVYRDEVQHNFPTPHTDMLEQFVHYRVPPDLYDDLANYDGSVMAERTTGLLSARCDREEANILALNLADEIVRGVRTWNDARMMFGEQVQAMAAGQPAPYTVDLMFETATADEAGDPDEPSIPPPGDGLPEDSPEGNP